MTSRHSRVRPERRIPPVTSHGPGASRAAKHVADAAPSPFGVLGAAARRTVLTLAVTAALVLTAQPASAAPAEPASGPDSPTTTVPSDPPTESDRVIVKFKDTAAPDASKEKVAVSYTHLRAHETLS